jgi:hypothetical protein
MKYLYSILVIVATFVALPVIIDYSTSIANHIFVYVKTGDMSDNPEPKKARDYQLSADGTVYSPKDNK